MGSKQKHRHLVNKTCDKLKLIKMDEIVKLHIECKGIQDTEDIGISKDADWSEVRALVSYLCPLELWFSYSILSTCITITSRKFFFELSNLVKFRLQRLEFN